MHTLIIIILGLVFIVLGIKLWQKGNDLLRNGKKSKAIIFKNNFYPLRDGGLYYPVVRFLTDKQEWITQELNIGYSPAKKEGAKLEVIYNPTEPTEVAVNSTFQLEILPRLFTAIGVILIVIGALEYLDIIAIP